MPLDDLPGTEVEEQVQAAADVAEEMERVSNGLVTKRQALAYLLLDHCGRTASEVSEHVGASMSTVYTLRRKGSQKIEGARNLVDLLE